MAELLDKLGDFYSDTQRMKEAEVAYLEALGICRQLTKTNPAAYQTYVAMTLSNLALLHIETGNPLQAAKESEESVSINRERWKANPAVAADDLARSLIVASQAQLGSSARCQLASEAAGVAQNPELKDYVHKKMAGCTPL